MPSLRVVLAQLNVTVGDLTGNYRLIEQAIRQALAWRADLVVLPELAVTGYPPEDLLLKPRFVQENLEVVARLASLVRGIVACVGCVDRDRQGRLFNAAAILADGRHVATYHKRCLPNYGVFDERRYFTPGDRPVVLTVGSVRVGLSICEDLWKVEPPHDLAAAGASLLVSLSASPYHAGKARERQRLFAAQARANHLAVAYCNLVGGQDELVFDGGSLILDARGRPVTRGRLFHDDLVIADVPVDARRRRGRRVARVVAASPRLAEPPRWVSPPPAPLDPRAEVYEALVVGLRDYVRKNGFATVVLGLSGGVDSSLTACLAVDALGPKHVIGVVMPSRYSSSETRDDARQLANTLGIEVVELSIEPTFEALLATLQPYFGTRAPDVTEQNLQARIRGTLLMALSNKFGWLVLTTGNKSEMATGYTTLYGDMAGGFAVIKDVPKTLVYALARHRNARGPVTPIPETVLRRAPTAELAPHQTDQDTLPPYEVLDRLLKAYVEEDRSLQNILSRNRIDPAVAVQVVRMVDRAEYKRRQGPPGIKITPRAFGKDRRMPITNRYEAT